MMIETLPYLRETASELYDDFIVCDGLIISKWSVGVFSDMRRHVRDREGMPFG